jgi:hypothetical protein
MSIWAPAGGSGSEAGRQSARRQAARPVWVDGFDLTPVHPPGSARSSGRSTPSTLLDDRDSDPTSGRGRTWAGRLFCGGSPRGPSHRLRPRRSGNAPRGRPGSARRGLVPPLVRDQPDLRCASGGAELMGWRPRRRRPEWCRDWYAAEAYGPEPVRAPTGPPEGSRRVSRGGAWRHQEPWSPVAHRSSLPPPPLLGLRLRSRCGAFTARPGPEPARGPQRQGRPRLLSDSCGSRPLADFHAGLVLPALFRGGVDVLRANCHVCSRKTPANIRGKASGEVGPS